MGRKRFFNVFTFLVLTGSSCLFWAGESLAVDRNTITHKFNWGDDLSTTAYTGECPEGTINCTQAPPTQFKSTHLPDIKQAIDLSVTACSITSDVYLQTDREAISQIGYPGKLVSSTHVNNLRRAIEELYRQKSQPPPAYLSGDVTTGTPILKAHINDMRRALDELVVGCSAPVPAVCGNGNIETGEQCDDSNLTNGDGCSSTCQSQTSTCYCDGAWIWNGLNWDDYFQDTPPGCSMPPSPGNLAAGNPSGECTQIQYSGGQMSACGNVVATYSCGGGVVCYCRDVGFGVNPQCDTVFRCKATLNACETTYREGGLCDTLTSPCDAYTSANDCAMGGVEVPVCGNGAVESGEQCDDSNTVNSDGCSSTCQTESGTEVAGGCGEEVMTGGNCQAGEPTFQQCASNERAYIRSQTSSACCGTLWGCYNFNRGRCVADPTCAGGCQSDGYTWNRGGLPRLVDERITDERCCSGGATCYGGSTTCSCGGDVLNRICGNGTCNSPFETCTNCPGDCGACVSQTCGNAIREGTEACDLGMAGNGPCPKLCSASCTSNTCAAATCVDGIQNQTETGVDCGGPCAACASPVLGPCGAATCYACGGFQGRQCRQDNVNGMYDDPSCYGDCDLGDGSVIN